MESATERLQDIKKDYMENFSKMYPSWNSEKRMRDLHMKGNPLVDRTLPSKPPVFISTPKPVTKGTFAPSRACESFTKTRG